MKHTKLNQAGETIVEVMISAAILAAVITASFVIVRRSLSTGQAAAERTQALKIVESQLERVKYLATQENSGVFATSGEFCVGVQPNGDMAVQPVDPLTNDLCDHGAFPESNLTVTIVHDTDGPDDTVDTFDDNTFTFRAEWDSVKATSDQDREQLEISYRIHPPEPVVINTFSPPVVPPPVVPPPVVPPPVVPPPVVPPPVTPPVACTNSLGNNLWESRYGFARLPINHNQPNADPYANFWHFSTYRSVPDFDINAQGDKNVIINAGNCGYSVTWKVLCSIPYDWASAANPGPRVESSCGGDDQRAEAARVSLYSALDTSSPYRRCLASSLIGYFDTTDRPTIGSTPGDGTPRPLPSGRNGAPAWTGTTTLVEANPGDTANRKVACINLTQICFANSSTADCYQGDRPLLNTLNVPISTFYFNNPGDPNDMTGWRPKVIPGRSASLWVDGFDLRAN